MLLPFHGSAPRNSRCHRQRRRRLCRRNRLSSVLQLPGVVLAILLLLSVALRREVSGFSNSGSLLAQRRRRRGAGRAQEVAVRSRTRSRTSEGTSGLVLLVRHSTAPSASEANSDAGSGTGGDEFDLPDVDDLWEATMGGSSPSRTIHRPYRSELLSSIDEWRSFLSNIHWQRDPFWEQIKLEATKALVTQPEAGPQLYQGILAQPDLLAAVITVISHEIETELMPATALKNLFLEMLTPEDEYAIRLDLQAAAERSPTVGTALNGLLFHNGFHALVCYRVGHRLWNGDRTALAYYMQSTVSRKYAADIHPACKLGAGTYLRVGGGVVIGETAVVGNDVCILEGVTLGGTGKEAGDRHPKVGNGVVIMDGGTVLGNIRVDDGALVMAKSIVNKPVPPFAIVQGVPAKIQGYRDLDDESAFDDDLQSHLVKYLPEWRAMQRQSELQ